MITKSFRLAQAIRRHTWKTVVGVSIGLGVGTAAWVHGVDAAPTPYAEGQKVEVREGDEWSQATILKHEGAVSGSL